MKFCLLLVLITVLGFSNLKLHAATEKLELKTSEATLSINEKRILRVVHDKGQKLQISTSVNDLWEVQPKKNMIKGVVSDFEKHPLSGVTITVLGTARGVITDNDGTYSIDVEPTDKLVFSFIGMESQIVDVCGITAASKWVSENTTDEHWLIVDLGELYTISSFQTYTGSKSLGSPNDTFSSQTEINGEWTDLITVTGNTNPSYGASFEPVETSRVRYYVPAYEDNRVRLFEFDIYSEVGF